MQADIGIVDGRIGALAESGIDAEANHDCSGQIVLPGLIDAHTHIRDPGFPEYEDFETGTRAAAAGGITTVLEMPTSLPGVSSPDVLLKRAAIVSSKAIVDFGLYGAAGGENVEEIEGLARAGAIAFKTRLRPPVPERREAWAGQLAQNDGDYLAVLEAIADIGALSCLHAENFEIVARLLSILEDAGGITPTNIARAYPDIVEVEQVQKAILLASHTGTRLSICHVNERKSIEAIQRARQQGQSVRAEAAFNNLFLVKDDVERFGRYAVSHVPTADDREYLWDRVRDRTIDQIASDHAPISREAIDEKWLSGGQKHFGLAAIEILLPFLLRAVNLGQLTLEDVCFHTSSSPAQAYGLYPMKGVVQVGSDADLVVIDMDRRGEIRGDELHSKTKFTIFEGEEYWGMPIKTFVRGELVMADGQITGKPGHGRWLQPMTPSPGRDL